MTIVSTISHNVRARTPARWSPYFLFINISLKRTLIKISVAIDLAKVCLGFTYHNLKYFFWSLITVSYESAHLAKIVVVLPRLRLSWRDHRVLARSRRESKLSPGFLPRSRPRFLLAKIPLESRWGKFRFPARFFISRQDPGRKRDSWRDPGSHFTREGDIALIWHKSMTKFNNSKLCVRNSVIISEEQPATQSLIACYMYWSAEGQGLTYNYISQGLFTTKCSACHMQHLEHIFKIFNVSSWLLCHLQKYNYFG